MAVNPSSVVALLSKTFPPAQTSEPTERDVEMAARIRGSYSLVTQSGIHETWARLCLEILLAGVFGDTMEEDDLDYIIPGFDDVDYESDDDGSSLDSNEIDSDSEGENDESQSPPKKKLKREFMKYSLEQMRDIADRHQKGQKLETIQHSYKKITDRKEVWR